MNARQKRAFDKIKCIVACDNLLTYLYFNETFKTHTNASAFRLGAVISQKGKPIALYIRKLTDTQKIYTVTEKELLSTVETLREFRTVLLDQKLRIYTGNKNLICKRFNNNRVLIWRIILEEYGPYIEYIKGNKNIVDEAL